MSPKVAALISELAVEFKLPEEKIQEYLRSFGQAEGYHEDGTQSTTLRHFINYDRKLMFREFQRGCSEANYYGQGDY